MLKYLAILVIIGAYETSAQIKYTHASAWSKCQAVGITISSSGGCSDRNKPSCTSLDQVNTNTIDTGSGGITTLKTASGCAIKITGGTETGHASGTHSHWNGYKLDIGLNTCIDNYIKTSFTKIADRGDGAKQWQSAAGNIYALEDWLNHWDITYL